jgi:hypothetical protein
MLSITLPQERVARAMRALSPAALVLCGNGATLDVVGRLIYTARQLDSTAAVFEYRDAMPVTGKHSIRSLGARPTDAADSLKAVADGGTFETVVEKGELAESAAADEAAADAAARAV